MPIFEYKCSRCGHITEFLVGGDNTKKLKCQKCGSSDLEKLFSAFAVGKLKGSSYCDACPTCTMPQKCLDPQTCPHSCGM